MKKERIRPLIKNQLLLFLMLLSGASWNTIQSQSQQGSTPQGNIPITGKIVDQNGEPLAGVTIILKWSTLGTISDSEGDYQINVPYANSTLSFSFLGFESQDIELNGRKKLRVTLKESKTNLDEVVVVGYGTQKRASVIGAITSIEPQKLQSNQTRSLSNGLIGQVAGIIGVQRSGEPGYDASEFWIRGISTFGANKNPLVIIDGVERSIDNISPDEIESFSILKDAAATAVYGVRGANGAIVIRTKRGVTGKTSITVKADYGLSQPTQLPSYVDGGKHMEVVNAARILSSNDGKPNNLYTPEQIIRTRSGYDPDLYPDVNWLDQVTKDFATNNHASVDINGGSDKIRYRFMLGTFNETGIIKTDPKVNFDSQLRLSRYNVRSNIDMDLTPSTLFSFSVGGYLSDRNAPNEGINSILSQTMGTPPIVYPAVYSSGEFPKITNQANPWVNATQRGYKKNYENGIQTVASLEQDFGKLWSSLNGLNIKLIYSFDAYNWHEINRGKDVSYYIANGRDENGNLILTQISEGQEFLGFGKGAGGNRSMYFELPINYSRTFQKVHQLSALLLYNMKDYVNSDANNAISALPYRNQGIAGRLAYSYNDRYFSEFNFGYNGSENFQKGYRFGFFPSFALGWMVNNEAFLKDVKSIDKIKLRGSWGKVGNDQITNGRRFGYVTTINGASGYEWGWTAQQHYDGLAVGDFGIPNLTWETATKTDIGIEIALFQSLSIQADYFEEMRSNIFMQRKTIPELAGYNNAPYANFGKVLNKGFDASIEYHITINKDWSISLMGNYTHAANKIKEYDEPSSILGTNRSRTNQSTNANFGLIATGLYTEDDFLDPIEGTLDPSKNIPEPKFGRVRPGDIRYKDLNGDGKIDRSDETALGSYFPETVYGFGFSLRYKKWDLSSLFQGSSDVTFLIGGNQFIPGSGDGSQGNILSNVDDRWTPENPRQDAFYPRLSTIKSENNTQNSTWWEKDGSSIRLKNFELGYTLVNNQEKTLSNARIFLRGSNLLTISNFSLWDPELQGLGYTSYPPSRIMSLGFQLTF